MGITIRELRDNTGLSQKLFAERYGIPVSTLRKWEQGESTPAPYVISMLAEIIPGTNMSSQVITGRKGEKYYYDKTTGTISDSRGIRLPISADIEGVKKENLPLYVSELFDSYYEVSEKFARDCEYDKKSNIIWG